jgi:DNA-binding transcriptional LysR family regulator
MQLTVALVERHVAELDDLALFAAVVEHGGFAAAERALGTPKSRLSRRVAALEADLGVRLLQRSTRRFSVTDVGQDVYRHARAMLEEARAAREAVARLSTEPRGLVRLACPVAFAQSQLSELLPEFLASHPQVQLQVHVSNRRVDLIEEGFDLALRVRSRLDDDASLVLRRLGEVQELLVASPAYLARAGRPQQPAELAALATLNMVEDPNRQQWELHGPDGEVQRVALGRPRLMGFDFRLLQAAAVAGQGIALLPDLVCAESLHAGELEVVLPQWRLPLGICHLVYPTRRGVLPAQRALIEFLVEQLPPRIETARARCTELGAKGGKRVPRAGNAAVATRGGAAARKRKKRN